MNYTKAQLVDALVHEWDYLCHDDYDPEDPTPEEYRKEIEELTIEQLTKFTLLTILWRLMDDESIM